MEDPSRAVLTVVGGPSDGDTYAIDPNPRDRGLQGWLIQIQTPIGPVDAARVLYERGRYFVQDAAGKLRRRSLAPGKSVSIAGCALKLSVRANVEIDIDVDVGSPRPVEPPQLSLPPAAAPLQRDALPSWTRWAAWMMPLVGIAIGLAVLSWLR